jgi:two-component system phosphate regulon sensor histidine kinase PhoR
VLAVGTLWLYRLGLRQLGLVRQQQAFVAAVSHELKTPLTSIRMYAEMLREGWVTDEKRARYYRSIQDESERLSRLVTNVLQLARMSHDELRVQPRPLALCELIDLARAGLTSLTARAGFELVIDCAEDALVSADPDALTQVLINLVDNAVKFSAKARVTRIEIGCWVGAEPHAPRRWYQGQRQGAGQGGDAASGQWGWIRIRDHGPGIPKAQRRRVFELFQRLEQESTRDTQGTGIGLALVQRLMRAMDGDVALIGREPGVEVRLRLRMVAATDTLHRLRRSDRPRMRLGRSLNKVRPG